MEKTTKKHFVNGHNIDKPFPEQCHQIIVAMGCFWGVEKLFWQADGIFSTAVGYIGGSTINPTYEEVCTGNTGHTEAVLIVYDPLKISPKKILKLFWEGHDPTQYMRQGNDIGSQYRSAVFFPNEMILGLIQETRSEYQKELTQSGYGEIVTEVIPEEHFYYAEDYHQQYLAKNPNGYCGLGGTGVCLK
ncbi:MAG: peptide-methionine (S)-S-oxide reductase MsrA [Gammaproteobacteria bacterium]|jgi:peptide-methionine (S)-S-oxide reductase|nr:peptide-methionine (S)-S-oxide reductase MsrA [Gammaproteobacteria bacterium]MBT5216322.1 peptide-methionine (S)-S-oxide reductase MsrA [Gammaproteobacteria bacterium]MBT5541304.1 peptide-methionine (S)-S-oxide reductase MsrA [Gammaproteobacteria bacterium]MBT7754004.1 peptide-methionine (S)-S-oxide reductase MsrA [Gammaproteobacteria bacterium]